MNKQKQIKAIHEKLNHPNRIRVRNLDRQGRLKELVTEHGLSHVALAGGYAESTLNQYIRVRNPSNIGEESVVLAEKVLSQVYD